MKYAPLAVSLLSAVMVLLILFYSINQIYFNMTGSFISQFVSGTKGYLLLIAALIGTCISCIALKCHFDGKYN